MATRRIKKSTRKVISTPANKSVHGEGDADLGRLIKRLGERLAQGETAVVQWEDLAPRPRREVSSATQPPPTPPAPKLTVAERLRALEDGAEFEHNAASAFAHEVRARLDRIEAALGEV